MFVKGFQPSFLSAFLKNLLQILKRQTKGKLGTPEARTIVDNIVNEQLNYYLMENGDFAKDLVKNLSKLERLGKPLVKREMKVEMAKTAA